MKNITSLEKSNKKVLQAVAVSRAYYLDGWSQTEISKKLNLSRPTISRLLQFAKDNGIVEIKINDPFQNIDSLKDQLIQKYGLKKVIIASQTNNDENTILENLGQEAANYLEEIVQNGDSIGITWGLTMEAVAKHLHESDKKNIEVIQLKGSVSNSRESNFSNDITQKFNFAFHTQAQLLPLPVIFDNAQLRDMVMKDRFINDVIEQGYQTNIVLFTVGTTRPDAMLFRLGYLSEKQIDYLKKNSVGDVLSQFITKDGEIADPELNARTISMPLDKLRHKEYSILIAGGEQKLQSVHAALLGNYANVLVVDQNIAQRLLEF
ncbi:sugar-binding transcriptional regulator [Agrilactobacillus yilanensis]|uniref:Sugar-binding transcriptional regulator n=1 Tax=Agrilactobacillus yilanensis TaxID=2485997 RepID=A0ABW4JA60_9LACO